MDDVLRQRLIRKIQSLPEEQVYQVMDYIEFLDTKYGGMPTQASGLQKLGEGLQDKMRKKAMNPATIREAFQIISTADKVLQSVSNAGKRLMDELTQPIDGDGDEEGEAAADISPDRTAPSAAPEPDEEEVVVRSSDLGKKPGSAFDGGGDEQG